MSKYDPAKEYAKAYKVAKDNLAQNDMSEKWAEDASRAAIQWEAYLDVGREWLCEEAGDRRRGQMAQMQSDLDQAKAMTMTAHHLATKIAAMLDLLDIPGEGGR